MSIEILSSPSPGRAFVLSNQAIARALLESKVRVAAFYPGSPVTEILDTCEGLAARFDDFVMEISANEKVALETAAGAAFAGARSFTSMKSVGLNVASDAFFSIGYTGVKAGMVLLIADDPFCHSSQSEQDARFFAEYGHVPMLEPATPQEAHDMVKAAFDLSERHSMLALIRTTTRVNHQSSVVEFGAIDRPGSEKLKWKDVGRTFFTLAKWARDHKERNLAELGRIGEEFETSPFNRIVEGSGELGVVTSGISFCYAMDALSMLGLKAPVLKLGTTYPLPRRLISGFMSRFKRVLVVEELLPHLETRLRAIAQAGGVGVEILGKDTGHFSCVGEYNVMAVIKALSAATGAVPPMDFDAVAAKAEALKDVLPPRPPTFCPGCPHRGTVWSLQKALRGRDVVLNNDIGCYSMMLLPPYERTDTLLSMGSSLGVNSGMQHVLGEKIVSLLGDSTFFHAALPGFVNAVRLGHDMTVVILENGVTAMTGQQASPASDFGPRMTRKVDIETLVRAIGVDHVSVMSAFDPKEGADVIAKALDFKGVSVVISRGPCALHGDRQKRKRGEAIVPNMVDESVCKSIFACVRGFHCPAIDVDPSTGQARIEEMLCNGCGNCGRLCPVSSMKPAGGGK